MMQLVMTLPTQHVHLKNLIHRDSVPFSRVYNQTLINEFAIWTTRGAFRGALAVWDASRGNAPCIRNVNEHIKSPNYSVTPKATE